MPIADTSKHTCASLGIDEFLYAEAQLLDEGDYASWMDLLAEDVVYRLPETEFVDRPDRSNDYIGAHHFNENKTSLQNRVDWLLSGLNNSEQPPSNKTRIISNIRLLSWDGATAAVASNFVIWISRWDGNTYNFVGKRRDMLRLTGNQWKILRREATLNSSVLGRVFTTFV